MLFFHVVLRRGCEMLFSMLLLAQMLFCDVVLRGCSSIFFFFDVVLRCCSSMLFFDVVLRCVLVLRCCSSMLFFDVVLRCCSSMLFLDVVLRCMRLRSVYGWDQEQRYWDDAAAEVEVSERARESGFGYEIDVAVQIHESWAHIFTSNSFQWTVIVCHIASFKGSGCLICCPLSI
jgi:hypothetical protein